MTRIVKLAIHTFAFAVALSQLHKLSRRTVPFGEDARTRYHQRMAPLAQALRGVAQVDYVGDAVPAVEGLAGDEATGWFFAQFHALPALVRPGSGASHVLVNLHGADAERRARALGLHLRHDLGDGLFVMER